MEVDSPHKAKATEKCRVKSSTKEKLTPVSDSHREAPTPVPVLVATAGQMVDHQPEETEANTSVVTVTGGGDASNEPQVDVHTLNQAREMVFHLLKQSKILDECQVRTAHIIGAVVSKCTTQLFQPFTSYISDVSDAVEAWHTKVTLICPEMSHCSYDTYCACSASICERINKFFRKLRDLNTCLNQQTLLPKPDWQSVMPDNKGDSGLSSSVDATALGNTSTESDHNRDATPPKTTLMAVAPVGENDPFVVEVATIMEDVVSSVQRYVQEVAQMVLQTLGRVEMKSYLSHIFSTGLNFQTSMWQLVMMETVDLPMVTREQLCWETGNLCLFAEVIPFLGSCSVPPPPFPMVEQPTPQTSGAAASISDDKFSSQSLPDGSQPKTKVAGAKTPTAMQTTPTSSVSGLSTPLSGRQRL